MSERRSAPSGNLAPPSPSPPRQQPEEQDVMVAEKSSGTPVRELLAQSAERPVASEPPSAQSTPNANAVTAAAAEAHTEEDVATPSSSSAADSAPRGGSAASSKRSERRSPSDRSTSDVAKTSPLHDAPPPLASGPPQRQHASVDRPSPSREQNARNDELVRSMQGSPARPQDGASVMREDSANATRMTIHGDPAAAAYVTVGKPTHANATRLSSTKAINYYEASPEAKPQGGTERRQPISSSVHRMHAGGSLPVDTAAGQRKAQSESFLNDSRLYNNTASTMSGGTAAAGAASNAGYTPSQRALVQYGSSPGDVATPSYLYRESVAPGSEGGYSPSRHAEIRAMLIAAERELAEVREECARRGMRLETMEAALDRERANTRVLRDRHADEAAATREEHETVVRQLRDQLHVLKMVSESAMAEKSKMSEEAGRRKKELLALLDREREEKSYIMADYREQTESLIAEQGREITSLRAALDKLKEDYDAVAKDYQGAEDERELLSEKVDTLTSQLDRERAEAASRVKELQANTQQECQALREQLEARHDQLQRTAAQQVKKQQELAEQLQKSEERQRVAEEEHQHALDALKQAYRRDTDGLREELQRLKESRDKQEEELRRELEKATKREAKTVEGLRLALEQTRKEKEACVDDGFQQREALQRQHREKLTALQVEMDSLAQQLTEERTARKDVEADAEVLRVRADSLDKANQRLTTELEAAQADQRSKERATEQAHQTAMEELRAKVRTTATELSYAQDQLTRNAADAQQLRDELAKRSSALEAAKEKIAKLEGSSAEEVVKLKDAAAQKERETAQLLSQMRVSKTQVEATCERLERQLKDAEGRLQGTAKQVEEERRALEVVNRKLQETKVETEDLRAVVAVAQERSATLTEEKRQLERQLEDARLYRDELENAVHNNERQLMELQQEQTRQARQTEGKMEELVQRHNAELAAARMASEQVRGEVARAREALVEKEAALQQLREEVGRLHREAALREGGLQEDMEDLREAHETEMRRMDELLNGLRSDLAKSQAMCTQYQRELSHIHRNSEGERSDLAVALEQADAARAKLLEDAKYRDQLNKELQGTVRLLSSRLSANEEEVRRMQEELADTNKKVQDAHTLIGRKDAAIGQLNAKLRAYEARGGPSTAL